MLVIQNYAMSDLNQNKKVPLKPATRQAGR